MTKDIVGFQRYFQPVLDALRELGGEATPSAVEDWVAKKLEIGDEERTAVRASGVPKFYNEVAWARRYLVLENLIDGSKRGVWRLTEEGRKAKLDEKQIRAIVRKWVEYYSKKRRSQKLKPVLPREENSDLEIRIEEEEISEVSETDHRELIRNEIMNLTPLGFERLCQRLLIKMGFKDVILTGKPGDKGIDGTARIELGPCVSQSFYFQCKQIRGKLSSPIVRNLRGSMPHVARGIIISTGVFTRDAENEAIKSSDNPIELMDGERLIDLLEQHELGLKPRRAFDVDVALFAELREAESNA